MLDKVKNFIEKEELLTQGDRVLVAVSGGADSVALLRILLELKEKYELSLKVIHVNHLFRGEEARQDGEFVRSLAVRKGLEVDIFEVPVAKVALEDKISKQAAGRKVRYQILQNEAIGWGATKIALGHHADDQGETLLIHLLRGSGLQGLVGMYPKRGLYIRPLISCTREEIESYCKEKEIPYRNDPSNTSLEYLRNRIRLNLIPYLTEQYNPRLIEGLNRTTQLLQWDQSYLVSQTKMYWKRCLVEEKRQTISLSLEEIKALVPALSSRIINKAWQRLTKSYDNLEFNQIEAVLQLIRKGQTGKELILSKEIRVEKHYEVIIFSSRGKEKRESSLWSYPFNYPGMIEVPELELKLEVSLLEKKEGEPNHGMMLHGMMLDEEKLPKELYLRTRRPGDWFKPLGSGTKKLKDYFIDKKIPRDHRDEVLLLVTKNQEIVAIVGNNITPYHKISENYKVDRNTKKVISLRIG